MRGRNQLVNELEELPVRRELKVSTCWHRRSVVNDDMRTVKCRDCGADLDPIAVLADLSRDRENLVHHRHRLRKDIEYLERRVADLKREERNTKSRIRRAKAV